MTLLENASRKNEKKSKPLCLVYDIISIIHKLLVYLQYEKSNSEKNHRPKFPKQVV